MTAARASIAAVGAAVLALLAVGLVELAGTGSTPARPVGLSAGDVRARLHGSPPALAALHAQGGSLLQGGLAAVRARIAALRGAGDGVVVNKWASWCEPCRAEFGAFQGASLALGRRVAFIGIDSADSSRAEASKFLRSYPVSYPSYYDASGQTGSAITYSSFTPVTVFIDARGRQYIHQGPYPSQQKLEADVRRYALAG
jgi:cytochrome c biogenesis protein CcmG, thiol:disulfide interchange protein DsbE